jgi:hypothetical protein
MARFFIIAVFAITIVGIAQWAVASPGLAELLVKSG